MVYRMINQDQFELHEYIVNWLMSNEVSFSESMSIFSYAIRADISIPEDYI